MNRRTKMALMRSRQGGDRADMTYYDSPMEARFRDQDGREHYNDGRFAPMNAFYGNEPGGGADYVYNARQGGRQGSQGGSQGGRQGSRSWGGSRGGNRGSEGRRDDSESSPMNRIGFELPPEFSPMMPRDEIGQRKGTRQMGYASGSEYTDDEFSHEEAMAWVNGMKNADGSTGPHWSMEQAEQIMREQKIQLDELEFFVTLNMMYSDYCKVAKKLGVSTTEFYACMAKAFLEDKDAVSDKLSRYYEYIVKN